jgi:phosphoribosylaminoimidazole-succinocarboxamide synthase
VKEYVIPANLELWHSGKVRDTADIPRYPKLLLPVASDRISTNNVTHLSQIHGKGELLTAQMLFFALKVFNKDIETHLVAWGKRIYEYLPKAEYDSHLHYRAVVVRKRTMNQCEFIYRDCLAGSLYYKYYLNGLDPYGLKLPPGLPLMYRFPETIFTPTEKSDEDDPINYRKVEVSSPVACALTYDVFRQGRAYLAKKGITLIDSKSEAAKNVLADEWLTGDCSRMAWTNEIHEGEEPPWLDKEVFRQEAGRMWAGGKKTPLMFSDEAISKGIARYHEAFEAITGMTLSQFQKEYLD